MRQRLHDRIGIALGALADGVFGDPRRGHPVALFGTGVSAVEKRVYRDDRVRGAVFASGWIGVGVVAGSIARRGGAVGVAAATFTSLGGTSLCRVGDDIADALDTGDVETARVLVSGLVGRDPSRLDEAGICRAAVESIAENTSDATVAP
ncbi:CobD/CbiB family cobalamin biosynthesis protein, partial [Gordonia humi]